MAEVLELQAGGAPRVRWWELDGVSRPPVCQISPVTREFIGMGEADPSPLEPNVWLIPGNAFEGDAPFALPGRVAVLNERGTEWLQVVDLRGSPVYDVATREQSTWEALGELPEGLTLQAPSSEFDVWQDGKWVVDVAARNEALTKRAALKKAMLSQGASNAAGTLQYAVDKGLATDQEQATLDAWKHYSLLLSRVEPGPYIEWPVSPDDAGLAAWLESRGYEDLPDLPATETN